MLKNKMRPIHPGEILQEEFLTPSDPPITATALARATKVPVNRITEIINGHRGITANTALRLATFFNTTPEFWMNLQASYDLRLAEKTLLQNIRKHITAQRETLVSA